MSIFKRNFIAYFLNPTGYVFICVFVLLSSIAAFLPDEFVNTNLANLSQLNKWFPLIMLIFIPAITMGIWSEERCYGTEELLMTMPISSRTIIGGKYAAALGVYSISLLFSMGANYTILEFLGNPDIGLFLSTYFGYWLIGAMMISISMFASFLTAQLTVAYIVGGFLNIPLLALQWADAAPVSRQTALFLKNLSIEHFFEPFGRGIISLASIVYFLSIPCFMLYLCLVILNYRSWSAKHPQYYGFHYIFRAVALLVIAFALVNIIVCHDKRIDVTEEKLSTLSRESLTLIGTENAKFPIIIEAWLSPDLPQEFVQTRLDIISVLGAIKERSKSEVFVEIHDTVPNTKEAVRVERQYDIRPQKVIFDVRGRSREEAIFLAVVFRCGPRTVVIPFLNRGLSVEYELVNALLSVGDRVKKRIGILKTAAGLMGRFDSHGNLLQKSWTIVDELEKQYLVEELDPNDPIPLNLYNAILAVQPSSLSPVGMMNLTNVVRQGQPTLIFEDPYPVFAEYLPGTKISNIPGMSAMFPPGTRGDPSLLWAMLGITFSTDILWKNYNPYPKLAALSEEYVFVDATPIEYNRPDNVPEKTDQTGKPKLNSVVSFAKEEPMVASLQHLLFPFCGSIEERANSETKFTPLIQTLAGGFTAPDNIRARGIRTDSSQRENREKIYTLAARITGQVPRAFLPPNLIAGKKPEFNVVLVSDVDLLTPGFFKIREMGTDVRSGVTLDFDNVNFILNAIDSVAGEKELIPVRARRTRHRTLTRIEETTRKIRDKAMVEQIAFLKDYEAYRKQEEDALQKKVLELTNKNTGKQNTMTREESLELQTAYVGTQQRVNQLLEEKRRQYERKVEESQREVDEFVRQVQGRYKLYTVLLPPILPLMIGLGVWFHRRRQQRVFRRPDIGLGSSK